MEQKEQNNGRTLKGIVTSDKMQKTAVVAVTRLIKHPKIKKYYKVTKKYKSHNENNQFKTGETVIIRETRPTSKDKRWEIVEKVK